MVLSSYIVGGWRAAGQRSRYFVLSFVIDGRMEAFWKGNSEHDHKASVRACVRVSVLLVVLCVLPPIVHTPPPPSPSPPP